MSEPVGYVYSWSDQYIYVLISSGEYRPSIGDLLYVELSDKYVILQVVGYEGEIPASPSSYVTGSKSKPPLYSIAKKMYAKTILFFEIKLIDTKDGKIPIVTKPTQPPPLDSNVYLITRSDPESEKIMKYLSLGIKPAKVVSEAVPVAWLRSGVAALESMRSEKYFENAELALDLEVVVPKHILVSGQTGSGKTTSIMGMITQWCLRGSSRLSWLIVDKHGEYSVWRNNSFLDVLNKAVSLNNKLDLLGIYVYILQNSEESLSKPSPLINQLNGSIDLTSISLQDLASVLNLPVEQISELEELIDLLINLFEVVRGENLLDDLDWINVFVRNGEGTGNLLALVPLLVDNVIRHEGVGEKEKTGLYNIILRTIGINIHRLRAYRRMILSYLGLRIEHRSLKTETGYVTLSILNDRDSVFKTTPLIKNEHCLVKILIALLKALDKIKTKPGSSRALSTLQHFKSTRASVPKLIDGTIKVDDIVEKLNSKKSSIVILDVSKIPTSQADMIVMSILRRLFEHRLNIGVEASGELARVAVVSEEAPLYLNPERVDSPYNIFARIAREGRKFGIGLIAITQLATEIDKQILANFNTFIALRTKYSHDLNYFSNIGISSETLIALGDREGYLYTPDLSVKEPIPVYIPGYFDYIDYIDKKYSRKIEEEITVNEIGKRILLSRLRE